MATTATRLGAARADLFGPFYVFAVRCIVFKPIGLAGWIYLYSPSSALPICSIEVVVDRVLFNFSAVILPRVQHEKEQVADRSVDVSRAPILFLWLKNAGADQSPLPDVRELEFGRACLIRGNVEQIASRDIALLCGVLAHLQIVLHAVNDQRVK